MTEVKTTADAVGQLDGFVAGIERRLDVWAAATQEWIASSGKLTGTAIDKFIRAAVVQLLTDPEGHVAGAGFIANAGLMEPERSYIAWWQGDDMERVDALANFSPQSLSRYVKAEWFRIPVETGLPHVTGPYIDFLCTDEYVLTFTHPIVQGDGSVAGIVGLDVTAQTFERLGLPLLRTIGPRAALVNTDGRTIVSAAPDINAGDIVEPPDGAEEHRVGRQFRLLSAVEATGL
ncbi:cache domain-containing protein [Arthrobacter sp. 35W]|uniref:cache domain-containing protein n=1 Tax=Arthrobacter sp. 35W TaxID=1132441 RepID=UPI00041CB0C1|nr:cache domain-containing protein [Arthrobacter sp. 35W]